MNFTTQYIEDILEPSEQSPDSVQPFNAFGLAGNATVSSRFYSLQEGPTFCTGKFAHVTSPFVQAITTEILQIFARKWSLLVLFKSTRKEKF